MNPTRDIALWFAGFLPTDAPEWMLGGAVFAGIFTVGLMMLGLAGIASWLIERRL